MLPWTRVCKYLIKILISIHLDVPLEGRRLDHMVVLFLTFEKPPCCLPHSHQPCASVQTSVNPGWHLLSSAFFIIAILTGVRGHLIGVLICISLMVSDVVYLFIPTGHLHFSLGEMSVQVLGPFLNWWGFFLLLSCKFSQYILETNPLADLWFATVLSHSTECLSFCWSLPLLCRSFWVWRSPASLFLLLLSFPRNHHQDQYQEAFLLWFLLEF